MSATAATPLARPRKNEPTVGVYEFCRRTGKAPSQVYEMLALGKLRGEKRGRRGVWAVAESEVARLNGGKS